MKCPLFIFIALSVADNGFITTLVIVGFPGLPPEHDRLMGAVLFLVYASTALGNALLVGLFLVERRLQKPMYIVMLSLAFSDIGFSTATLPKAVGRYWLGDGAIALGACLFQRFLVHYFGTLNSLIMMTMSLDRYLAICSPLRYPALMTNRAMSALTAASWAAAAVCPGVTVGLTARLPFCGPRRIAQCHCDALSLMPLICADTRALRRVSLALAMFVLVLPLAFIVFSYASIAAAVLRIADAQGRRRAFSTCATQVCIIAIYYLPRSFVYVSSVFPVFKLNPDLRIGLTLFYSLFPPLVNPLIYCYRTKEIKDILRRWFCPGNAVGHQPTLTTVSK
ncbi:odorant receptor 104-1 [Conger conger]|uniref:odorant receptor 104-1 n=1 Tax=Conger conger TaxID=82655 RepID=UPI002A5A0FDF|nr:odorant receptor 104-1 [Conger conger]